MKRALLLGACCFALCGLAAILSATTTPQFMNYQGRLTNSLGSPIDLTTPMTFTIYADSIGGVPIWTEIQDTVLVRNGLFTVRLGKVVPVSDTVFKSDRRWLEIRVGTDVPLSPRTPFVSVAYAFRSTYADSCTFIPTTDTLWRLSGGNIYRQTGNVGIGTSNPASLLCLQGASSPPAITFQDASHPLGGSQSITVTGGIDGGLAVNADPGNALVVKRVSGNVGIGTTNPGQQVSVNGMIGVYPQPWVQPATRGLFLYHGGTDANIYAFDYTAGTPDPLGLAGRDISLTTYDAVGSAYQRLFIHNNGSVGIGTVSPNTKLDVFGPVATLGATNNAMPRPAVGSSLISGEVHAYSQNGFTADDGLLRLSAGGGTSGGTKSFIDISGFSTIPDMYNNIVLGTSNVERVRIDWSGNVGIGTTSPSCKLDVVGQIKGQTSTAGTNTIEGKNYTNYSGVAGFNYGNGPGVYGYSVSSNREDPGVFGHNVATSGNTAGVYGLSESTAGAGLFGSVVSGGFGVYGVEPAGGSGWAVYSDGDCKVTGKMSIGAPSATNILTIALGAPADPIADAWTVYSSRRWKENISPIPNALDKVSRLRGVYYDWKETHKHDLGMIAEEVGAVLPEIVQFEENGVDAQSLDYARLSAVLVEAVKELKSENDDLRKRLEQLELRLTQYGATSGSTK